MFPPPNPAGGGSADPDDDDALMDEDAMLQAAIAASMETAAAEQQAAGGGGPAPMHTTGGGEEPAPPPSFSLAEETAGAGAGAGAAAAAPSATSLAASLAAALSGAAAAGAQQAAPAPPSSGVSGQQLAAALAQAFHAAQAAAAAAGSYSVVAPAPAAPPRRSQQQQEARPRAARILPPAPAWAKELAASAPTMARASSSSSSPAPPAWLLCGGGPASSSSSSFSAPVEVPAAERAAVASALSSALGSPALLKEGENALSRSYFDAAVREASSPAASLARRSSSAGGGSGGAPDPQILVLAAIHDRAAASVASSSSSSPAAAAPALRALAAAAARAGVSLLAAAGDADVDDLFFETVPSHEALASGLARGRVSVAFLDSCLAATAGAWAQGGEEGGAGEQQLLSPPPPPLLTRALASSAWPRALSAALSAVADAKLSDLPDAWGLALAPLDAMTSRPQLAAALAAALAAEALAAAPRGGSGGAADSGAAFERASFLAPLLRVSPFPDVPTSLSRRRVVSPARGVFESLRGYPERYGEAVTASRGLAAPLEAAARAAHGCAERAARTKFPAAAAAADHPTSTSSPPTPLPATAPREALLAWIAAAADALAPRASGGDKGALEPGAVVGTASDAFALGLSALCLRLCRPFSAAAAPTPSGRAAALSRLDPSYYGGAGLWRLPGVAEGSSPLCPALAARARGGKQGKQGGDGGDDGGGGDGGDEHEGPPEKPAAALPFFPYFNPDPSSATPPPPPHFVADCFFLTQRVVHVGLMPAINRFQEGWDHFSKLGQAQAQAAAAAAGSGDAAAAAAARAGPSLEESLFRDCGLAHLGEPSLVNDAVAFAALTATWLHGLLASSSAASASAPASSAPAAAAASSASLPSIASVPEYALRDACGLLSFILRCGGADVVGGADAGALVGALAALLAARVPCSAASSASASAAPSSSSAASAGAPPLLSPLSAAACVELLQAMLAPQLDGGRRRSRGDALGPAAMSPGERALVATVLAAGGRAGGASALVPALMRAHAGCDVVVGLDVDRDRFDKFGFRAQVDALLMELWSDASCLSATAALAAEAAKRAGDGRDGAVSGNEFGDYVGSVLNSLIYLLEDCINRLQAIQENEQQQRSGAWDALPARERSKKEAYLRSEAGVTRGFMRMALSALDVLARLAGEPAIAASFAAPLLAGKVAFAVVAFLNSVAGDRGAALTSIERPERFRYDPVRLQKAMVAIALRLRRAQGGAGGGGGDGGSSDAGAALVKALAAEPDFVAESLRRAAVAAGATDYGARAGFEALIDEVEALRGGGGASSASADATGAPSAAAGGAPSAAMTLDLSLPTPQLSGPELEAAYSAALGPLSFGEFDASAPRGYSRAFAAAADGGGPLSRRAAKRIAKELKELQQPGALPLSPAASIFVRAASDRLDKARAMLTGPEGTPYHGGCFLFDVLFPARYPDVPPLLSLDTTGGGRARLNPNLYADGKVCLSLLGTWHGSDASEKWDADAANLWRVLVSVQGMILVADPYFNEPGVEAVRGTPEGDAASARYNARLSLNVVRHAMNGMLDAPPPGFEEVVKEHFRLVGRSALEAAAKAAEEAARGSADAALAAQLRAEVEGLRGRLVKLLAEE